MRIRPGLIGEELEEARLDPAWEARHSLVKRVVCRVCGKFMAEINANGEHSHLRTHDMTAVDYASKYPGARFCSIARAADQSRRQGRESDVQKFMEAFARNYVTASELIGCRKDHEWEERNSLDFVVCRRCGLKSKTDLHAHAKRHGYRGAEAYRAQYPKAPWVPLGLKRGYRKSYAKGRYARRKAHLAELEAHATKYPADWTKKPIEWRIIGTELLREEYTSNLELADTLSASRILDLSRYGKTPRGIVESRAFKKLVNEIRNWVNRPGKKGSSKRVSIHP
jgi:hypothetical protein